MVRLVLGLGIPLWGIVVAILVLAAVIALRPPR